jgi:hypothetical protein
VEFLGSSDALDKRSFENTNVGGLSALTYDPRLNLYYSLVDREVGAAARFYTVRLPLDRSGLCDPEIFGVTILHDFEGRPFIGRGTLDGEGIALTSEGEVLVASETEPSIRRFSLEGRLLEKLPVPERFLVAPRGEAQENGTFAGLAVSPDGNSLFVAPQKPLVPDEQGSEEERKRLRILRYEDRGSAGFEPVEEFFYLTEPGKDVTDIAALSETDLLVLERGNRIFRASLDGAAGVSNEETLAAPGLVPLKKELLVDLADCVPTDAESVDPDFSQDSYQGLALGPDLPGGRRALLLQADDGFRSSKVTRLVAVGVPLQRPASETDAGACD